MRDLITGFIPDEWLHGLDYATLEKYPNEFISDDFRRRADDIIWRVKVGGEWIYLYFMIEFQSSVDRYMALRVMVYLGLLYQDLIDSKNILADGRLPPVLPIVLYNGDDTWTAPADIKDLIPAVSAHRPRSMYCNAPELASACRYSASNTFGGFLSDWMGCLCRISVRMLFNQRRKSLTMISSGGHRLIST